VVSKTRHGPVGYGELGYGMDSKLILAWFGRAGHGVARFGKVLLERLSVTSGMVSLGAVRSGWA
jgi:hypothetical protein